MPATLNSLTNQQKQTLAYIAGFIVLLALSAGMFLDLSRRRTEAASKLAEIEQKEIQVQNTQMPSEEDLAEWESQEKQQQAILISDENVPQFFEELTRIGTQNNLQPAIDTENKTIDPNAGPPPEEAKLLGLGIRQYMVMTVTFKGQYPDVARFLSEVSQLRRPVEFKKIVMRRGPPLVDVTITLYVYKREAA